MISVAIALYDLTRRIYDEESIVSGLFDSDGSRVHGEERLGVEKHPLKGSPSVWWYSIEPIEGYQFIRIPVNVGGVVENLGTPTGDINAEAGYFRYIPVPDGKPRGGEIPKVKVSFIVLAHKPSDLLSVGKRKL